MRRRKREPTGVTSKCLDSDRIVSFQKLVRLMFCFVVFSYVLIAFSEILTSITGLEYAFTKAPRNMRSLVMSALLFTGSLSAAVGEVFVCKSFST